MREGQTTRPEVRFVSDSEVERMERLIANKALAGSAADVPVLARAIRDLIDDRRWRICLLQEESRQLVHLRQRLRQAAAYLEGLVDKADKVSRVPWPKQLPCPHCGAPFVLLRSELRQRGHVTVHDHPDGRHCEDGAPGQTSGASKR